MVVDLAIVLSQFGISVTIVAKRHAFTQQAIRLSRKPGNGACKRAGALVRFGQMGQELEQSLPPRCKHRQILPIVILTETMPASLKPICLSLTNAAGSERAGFERYHPRKPPHPADRLVARHVLIWR